MSVFKDLVSVRYLGAGPGSASTLSSWFSSVSFGTVILAGFAGALSPGLSNGSGCILRRVSREGSPALDFPEAWWWAEKLEMSVGEAIQSDQIVSVPGEKKRLHAQTGANIVDMESHSWMKAIREAGLNGVAVRIVSDTAEDILPAELEAFADSKGRMQLLRGGLLLCRKPASLARFFKILPALLRARKTLVSFGKKLGTIIREGAAIR
ncbi:MAG: phosphorylase family protein [Leptospirales bacterium]